MVQENFQEKQQLRIFGPFFATMLLTTIVWVYLFIRRIHFLQSKNIRPEQLMRPGELARISPPAISNPSDNLKNLFEMPVLFYALSIYLFITQQVDTPYVVAAWIFFIFRVLHSSIHLYGCWLLFDYRTDSKGGRWSNRFRRLCIWKQFANYFPLKLIKSEDLDPNRNYIFGYHPHGAFSLSAFGNFATDATHFSILFPNIRPHLMLLRLQFLFPCTRDLFLNLGACCVSRRSCEYLLSGKCGQGNALVIVLGGVPEMHATRNDTMIFYIKRRKGFVKLALKHGASLVPVISFGENELYERRTCFNLIPNGIPCGRSIVGHIPFRHPVITVVGKPIHVNKIVDPTATDIDQLHNEYIQPIEQLFEVNKCQYGLEHINLEII
ncbi:unnamed protein product [Rotaria sp. Silwood1]|nr:unnamed protein product [Rotaria sp. Silwood1]CAF3352363.1 unnamed protein product [Rotaria sp. Silwood1]CAF3379795.1 unnamed protein product [Rotaria sp. Silwood1]CAF4646873.1 unnamed protein product [Rotaria sp. Silwood1]CAF4840737.1 unnamed protein product [Rotaria sp. Silwood1]